MDNRFYLKKTVDIEISVGELLEVTVYFKKMSGYIINSPKLVRGEVKIFTDLEEAENTAEALGYEVCRVPRGFFAV